jgi:predicted transcriptional regulator
MRVTINIPDELHAWLKARAKAEDTTMRVIILQAIDEILRTKNLLKFPSGRLVPWGFALSSA